MKVLRPTVVALALAALTGCSLRETVITTAVREQAQYIPDAEHYPGHSLDRIGDDVYSFRWRWSRNLVLVTSEGVVVTDPYGPEAAKALQSELGKVAPGKPIHTVFYSHYHLDHITGAAALSPQRIVAHAASPKYWADLGDIPATKDVAPPTELIEGDRTYTIGGQKIELLYAGKSHTDTMYAFYLPEKKLLHTIDLALVRTVFPIGGPDMYFPGIQKQLDRLAALDFDAYVPSHFDMGRKADFLEAKRFHEDVQRLTREAMLLGPVVTSDDYERAFRHAYRPLKAKYGKWRGFESEILFLLGRSFSGVVLGY